MYRLRGSNKRMYIVRKLKYIRIFNVTSITQSIYLNIDPVNGNPVESIVPYISQHSYDVSQ